MAEYHDNLIPDLLRESARRAKEQSKSDREEAQKQLALITAMCDREDLDDSTFIFNMFLILEHKLCPTCEGDVLTECRCQCR